MVRTGLSPLKERARRSDKSADRAISINHKEYEMKLAIVIAIALLAGCAAPVTQNGAYSFALLPVDFGYPKYAASDRDKQACAEDATAALLKDGGGPDDIAFRRVDGVQEKAYRTCMDKKGHKLTRRT
jgi:hypothetical protein